MARNTYVEAIYTPPTGCPEIPFTCYFRMSWFGLQDFLNHDPSKHPDPPVMGFVCGQIKTKMKRAGYTRLPRMQYTQITLRQVNTIDSALG